MKFVVHPESPYKRIADFEINSPICESDKLSEMFRIYEFLSNRASKSKNAVFEVSYRNYDEKEYQSQIKAAVSDFHNFLSYCNLSFTSWTVKETLNTYNKTTWFKDKEIIIKTAITSFPSKPLNEQFDEMLNKLVDCEFIKRFEQTNVFTDIDAFLQKSLGNNETQIEVRTTAHSIKVKWGYDAVMERPYEKEFTFASYGYKALTVVQQASLCVMIKRMFAKEPYELNWKYGPRLAASKQTKKDVPLPLKEW